MDGDAHLDDSFRLLGRMTAGVVHDLNNYLLALRVSLDLLEHGGGDRLLWTWAREAVESAIELNRNLLEYARGSAPEPGPVDLGRLVRRMLGMIGRLIPPEIVVIVDEASNVPDVRGVGPELEQVVLNLVMNACDAMPNGGELRIRTRVPGPSAVIIDVMDTGCGGVRAGAHDDAVTPSSKPGRSGRGLGLGIVRAVVDRHRAVMKVAARDGGGTVVSVILEPWRE